MNLLKKAITKHNLSVTICEAFYHFLKVYCSFLPYSAEIHFGLKPFALSCLFMLQSVSISIDTDTYEMRIQLAILDWVGINLLLNIC